MAPGQVFHYADVIATFAWLEFCGRYKIDFWETVVDHLSQAQKQRSDEEYMFTTKQVKNKLISYLRKPRKPYSFKEIFAVGSEYFESLTETTRRDIRKELLGYEVLCSQTPHQNTRQLARTSLPRSFRTGPGGAFTEMLPDVELPGDTRNSTNHTAAEKIALSAHTLVTRHETPAEVVVNSATVPTNLRSAEVPFDQKFREDIRRKDIEISNIREQWQQEVDELSQQHARSAQTEIELRAQIKHLEMARDARRLAGRDTLEDELFQVNNNIWSLTRKVQEMQILTSFTVQAPRQTFSEIKSEIQNTMDHVNSELESILNGHDTTILLQVPSIDSNSDLGALVRSMSGNCISIDQEVAWLKRCIMRSSSSEMVVRALTAAALREWVFATPFPNFVPTPCPLLRAYQEAMMTQNNWKGLHNLDLVAHHILIDRSHFQENTIPYNAKELAARLSKALAGLFSRSDNERENAIFESWGQDRLVWENRRCRFTGIFEAILRLKAFTVTTDQLYEFVVYPPSTSHIGEAQRKARTAQSSRPNTSSDYQSEGARGCWLHASIHVYPTKASRSQDQLADALMNSKNFITRTEREREESCLHTSYIAVPKAEPINFASQSTLETPEQQMQRSSRVEVPNVQRESEYVVSNTVSTDGNSGDEYSKGDKIVPAAINTVKAAETAAEKEQSQPWKCAICGGSFSREASLTRHQNNDACPLCKECKEYFPSTEELSEHRNRAHNFQPQNSTSRRLLPSKKQPPQVQMDHQNAAQGSKAAEEPKKKPSSTPSKSLLTTICEICGRGFPSRRTCNIYKGRLHKQRQEPQSLEGPSHAKNCTSHLGPTTEPNEDAIDNISQESNRNLSVPCLEQDQASLDDEATQGQGPSDGTGSWPVDSPAQPTPGEQTNVEGQRNGCEPSPVTVDGVHARPVTSTGSSKRPRSAS